LAIHHKHMVKRIMRS